MAQLEQGLGVRLIERSTRSIQVTEIGRDVFAQCEVIAGGLQATEAIVARSRDEVRGSLRVACPPKLRHILGPSPMTTFLSSDLDLGAELDDTVRRDAENLGPPRRPYQRAI